MDFENIKQLINLIDQSGISEMKLKEGEFSISLKKKSIEDPKISNQELDEKQTRQVHPPETEVEEDLFIVKAPLVGVFYAAPSPSEPPFVNKGDQVMPDTALCIIEAMKIMNEIEAEVQGEIVEIMVNNEQVVEAGQPIMKIRRYENV